MKCNQKEPNGDKEERELHFVVNLSFQKVVILIVPNQLFFLHVISNTIYCFNYFFEILWRKCRRIINY